ncbi:unnamed protein product [Lampetra planeri]
MGGAALALLREALGRAAVQLQELWGDGADRRSLGRRELLAPRAQCESSPRPRADGIFTTHTTQLGDVQSMAGTDPAQIRHRSGSPAVRGVYGHLGHVVHPAWRSRRGDVTASGVGKVSKLNRRLQRVETEAAERAQRDHLLYGATLALALINTWLWMRR